MKKGVYSDEPPIEILDWHVAVRKRPGMYIGNTFFSGFSALLRMVIQTLFSRTACNHFEIDITDKLNGKITFYNIQSSIKDSINEDLHLGSFEFAVLNALCKKYEFILLDVNKDILTKQTYQEGILKNGKIEQKVFFSDILKIEFNLDDSIWSFEKINVCNLTDDLRELAFLCSEKKFEIKYLERGEESRIVYNFENGLIERLRNERNWSDAKITNYSKKEFNNFSIELAFGLSPFYYTKKFIGSYVNFTETEDHGTHIIGLIKGIKKGLKQYVKKNFPNKKVLPKSSAIKKYLFATIHVKIENPIYKGATRSRLQTYEIIKPISKYVAGIILQELEKDSKSAEDIIRHFEYV